MASSNHYCLACFSTLRFSRQASRSAVAGSLYFYPPQMVSISLIVMQQVGTYSPLSVIHSLPLARDPPSHSLEISFLVCLCPWVLFLGNQRVTGTHLSTFAAIG